MNFNLRLKIMAIIFFGFMAWQAVTPPSSNTPKKYPDVPWNVTFPSENTMKVLGVTLGKDTVEDVKRTFKSEYELGLYVDNNETPSLEAYFNSVKQAGLSAKVIVHVGIENQPWQQWRDNHAKFKSLPNKEKKFSLSADDFRRVQTLPINLMTYIPTAILDEDVINKRFGTDYKKTVISELVTYFVYKTKGMTIRLDEEGKEIISYSHPKNFDWLMHTIRLEIEERTNQ